MTWHKGDMFEAFSIFNANAIGFTANSTVNVDKQGRRLIMGAGTALAVRTAYPSLQYYFGRQLEVGKANLISRSPLSYEAPDYFVMKDREDFESPWVYAIQVKRGLHRLDPSEKAVWWDLTQKSLHMLSVILDNDPDLKLVMNCPLIGRGGYGDNFLQVKDMIERIMGDRHVIVCIT